MLHPLSSTTLSFATILVALLLALLNTVDAFSILSKAFSPSVSFQGPPSFGSIYPSRPMTSSSSSSLSHHASTALQLQQRCFMPCHSLATFQTPRGVHCNRILARSTSFALNAKPDDNLASKKERGPPKRKTPKDDVIQVTGKVIESLPNAMFRVEIEPSKQLILATISGKIRKNFVRIIVGDSVVCDVSAYDLTRGRITYRNK